MGSGTSKARRFGSDRSSSSSFSSSSAAPSGSICSRSSTSSRRRHRARSLFQSSCLGSSSRACDSDNEEGDAKICNDHDDGQVRAGLASGINLAESDPHEVAEHYQKLKVEHSNEMPAVPSNSVDLGEWIQASNVNNSTRGLESPPPGPASSGHSLNLSSRFLSHFSFIPGSVSFRLGRASSLGSGTEFPVSPEQSPIVNDSEELQSENSRIDSVDGHDNPGNRNLRTRHFSSSMTRNHLTNVNGNLWRNHQTSSLSNTPRNYGLRLSRDGDLENSRSRSHVEIDNLNARHGDWRTGSREPMDHNVQFSRTLSVGRLRDRVLRRPSFSDLTLSPLQRDTTRNDSIEDETRTGALTSLDPDYPQYAATSLGNETLLQSREPRLHNVLQNRSNFLERRRRIRSQVRALERLGSRSETISRHERSCILSGRHRPGQCTCHMNGRESNSNNDGGARASISRIVMLAEALFEVLDEIHQQAVALSSRPSVSSIGSVPAPSEVVESLPVKIYSKSTRLQTEEVAQCYICLIEYEEGDSMRILPCHHEFHRSCIDKWLKEIHRVCPLCRGDICCRSGL